MYQLNLLQQQQAREEQREEDRKREERCREEEERREERRRQQEERRQQREDQKDRQMMNMIGAALAVMKSAIAAGNPRANMVMRPGQPPLIEGLEGGRTMVVEPPYKDPYASSLSSEDEDKGKEEEEQQQTPPKRHCRSPRRNPTCRSNK